MHVCDATVNKTCLFSIAVCLLFGQNGTLKIVDRKKHIFKLAQGEYIAPEKIENVYTRSEAVAQAFVHGDSLQVRQDVFLLRLRICNHYGCVSPSKIMTCILIRNMRRFIDVLMRYIKY